jgi:magnesium transporter
MHTGEHSTAEVVISLIEYDETQLAERTLTDIEECYESADGQQVAWINVDGLHDVDLIEKMGNHFKIHPLAMEDVVSTMQRPKVEEYDGHFFVIMRMLDFDPESEVLTSEQVSLIVGERFLFSFQERQGDVFEPVRLRLRTAKGKIRGRGADYLAYSLIDAVVDHYFRILEMVGDRIEELEDDVLTNMAPASMHRIHHLRREMLILRRAVWPLREAIGLLYRGEVRMVQEETRLFLRDAHDHCVQVIDTVETLREVLTGSMELYMSGVSNRLNEVMKVLTVISTIFIPLSFFAGVYGMNFEYMPELGFRWGYPILMAAMAAAAAGMLWYFRRKGWF